METLALSGADVEVEAEHKPSRSNVQPRSGKQKPQLKWQLKAAGGSMIKGVLRNSPALRLKQVKRSSNSNSRVKLTGSGKGGSGGEGPCRFYAIGGECKMGRTCWSFHDFGKASALHAQVHRTSAGSLCSCAEKRGRPGKVDPGKTRANHRRRDKLRGGHSRCCVGQRRSQGSKGSRSKFVTGISCGSH